MQTFKELESVLQNAEFVRYLSHYAHDAVLVFEKHHYFN